MFGVYVNGERRNIVKRTEPRCAKCHLQPELLA